MEHNEVASRTVSTEGTLLTAVIKAQEGRDIATCDIPNAFVQPHGEGKDKEVSHTIMKIRGGCVQKSCMYTSHELYMEC